MNKPKYSELLKDPRWQKKRLQVLEQDNFQCQFCGDTKTTLHVHHFTYKGNPWDAADDSLCTICEDCHWIEHHKKNLSKIELGLLEHIHQFNAPFGGYEKLTKKELIGILNLREKFRIYRKEMVTKLLQNG